MPSTMDIATSSTNSFSKPYYSRSPLLCKRRVDLVKLYPCPNSNGLLSLVFSRSSTFLCFPVIREFNPFDIPCPHLQGVSTSTAPKEVVTGVPDGDTDVVL